MLNEHKERASLDFRDQRQGGSLGGQATFKDAQRLERQRKVRDLKVHLIHVYTLNSKRLILKILHFCLVITISIFNSFLDGKQA